MDKEILINAGAAELRVAIVEDGRLQELFLERVIGLDHDGPRSRNEGRRSLVGDIILGRVQRVLPAVQAAFVNVGMDRSGFLGAREARCLAGQSGIDDEPAPRISDCVREGEDVVVQVIKDPIGDKGARLSASVTIPGRLVVMAPNQTGVAVSRRIDDEAERARLTALAETLQAEADSALVPDVGYILRSAAVGCELGDLREDAGRLAEIWRQVVGRRAQARAPATLYRDLDAIERTMRDQVDGETRRVLIDDREACDAARAYCRGAMPESEGKIELYSGPGMLFDLYDIEDEIERLARPRVPLPSGGWATIEGTEALTAIDVNSGSYTAAAGLEETGLKVNLEAADEIGRQLRLRGIGGLIVIDFIHLDQPGNVARLLETLMASLARDRTPTQLSGMSEFGLVEITRKRVREPLIKIMTEACHICEGLGRVRTRESVALAVIRSVEREAVASPGRPIVARAAPEIVDWLDAHDDDVRTALARRGVPRVSFVAGAEFTRDGFDVGPETT